MKSKLPRLNDLKSEPKSKKLNFCKYFITFKMQNELNQKLKQLILIEKKDKNNEKVPYKR